MERASLPPTILIVEDEPLIAMTAEDMFIDLGFDIKGIVAGLTDALQLIETMKVDYAFLDINLGREKVFPVAEVLHLRGTKLIFASGDDGHDIPYPLQNYPIVTKPYLFEHIKAAAAQLMS